MGTWISHLRIAEKLLAAIPDLDEISFTFGNLSPDSGLPNADWTQFEPPKSVTHFLHSGNDEAGIHDLEFYCKYLSNSVSSSSDSYSSFALGYFFHLLCDNLWAKRIVATMKREQAGLFLARGKKDSIELIKTDWYGLDQRFVRDHPESIFWRVLLHAPNPPQYLPFIPPVALNHQLDYIRKFYAEPDATWVLDRAYPYLNGATMTRFVDDATASLLKIYSRLGELSDLGDSPTALMLLAEDEIAPYVPPLGDLLT